VVVAVVDGSCDGSGGSMVVRSSENTTIVRPVLSLVDHTTFNVEYGARSMTLLNVGSLLIR
jgi:hypothetical protein